MIIFRISTRAQWEQAQKDGFYTDESLNKEGFIHMSEHHQLISVANYLYKGQKELVLIAVNTEKLTSEVRYEQLNASESFPHIYGTINLDAVVKVVDFPPDSNGSFRLSKI